MSFVKCVFLGGISGDSMVKCVSDVISVRKDDMIN